MATVNYKNSSTISITGSVQTVPAFVAPSGDTITVSADEPKMVVGTGTTFLADLKIGSWILDLSNKEVRKVVRIISDTVCEIDYAFSNAVSGATFRYIPPSRYKGINVYFSATGSIDGVATVADQNYPFQKGSSGLKSSASSDFIAPLVIDPGAGTATVTTI